MSGLGFRKAEPATEAEFLINANDEFGNYVDSLAEDESFQVFMTECETTINNAEADCTSCEGQRTSVPVTPESASTRRVAYTLPAPILNLGEDDEWAATYYM
eukprot:SAG11_NODE_15472_length_577_cov_0.721757_1_plen_101_part_10